MKAEMIAKMKIEQLKKMDKFIRQNMDDEEDIIFWLTVAVPDNASEEDYVFIANDEELFNTCCRVFSGLVVENEQ